MRQKTLYFFLLVLISAALLIPAWACITIIKQPATTTPPVTSSQPPVILAFAADTTSIDPGGSVNLSWQVSGASAISITPDPGSVQASGSAVLRPQNSTTYLLTAENSAGSVNRSLTISVRADLEMADLALKRVFIQASSLYFVVKNEGSRPSTLCRAQLYWNGVKDTTVEALVTELNPGQEKTFIFGKFTYHLPSYPQSIVSLEQLMQDEFRVCLDEENIVPESNKANNCLSIILGPEWAYSFYTQAHLARWFTGVGELVWPVPESSPSGSSFTSRAMVLENVASFANVIGMYPQAVAGGWISGTFGEFYTDENRKPQVRQLLLPRHLRFRAAAGFASSADPAARAKFTFTLLDQSYTPVYVREIIAQNDGEVSYFDEDLSPFAKKECTVVLRVDSMGVPGQDLAVWADPLLTQAW
jgi:hypothetical protein